jgi:hypothetical protein
MADLYPVPVTPAHQAGNILRAWACRDEAALRKEFTKGLDLRSSPHGLALEEENLELLKAVVARLNECPAVLNAKPADPIVKLCISLLMHLAGRPYWSEPSEGSSAAGQDQT